jgi:hypothetical protein
LVLTRGGHGPAAFLAGTGQDDAGRTIAQVLAFDGSDLEMHHDYIQWLFPLNEPSRAVSGSPVLTTGDIGRIRNDTLAATNLRAAATRMGAFYDSTSHWLGAFDHNHLRITRIIKSLRLLLAMRTRMRSGSVFLRAFTRPARG